MPGSPTLFRADCRFCELDGLLTETGLVARPGGHGLPQLREKRVHPRVSCRVNTTATVASRSGFTGPMIEADRQPTSRRPRDHLPRWLPVVYRRGVIVFLRSAEARCSQIKGLQWCCRLTTPRRR
jgi:hypothetical protein